MTRKQILETIKDLAKSQGFYGRLYEQVKDNKEALDLLESQGFESVVDLVLWLET